MKKTVSLILVICMCLSLAAVLTSCVGGKNAWQEYLGAKGWDVRSTDAQVKNESGTVGAVKDGYSLTGGLEVKGRGNGDVIVAYMKDRLSHVKAVDGVTDEKYDDIRYIDYRAYYHAKDNYLYVEVSTYQYYTTSVGEKNGEPDWKDGLAFAGTGTGVTLRIDMASYFENGVVTADDITESTDFDVSLMTRNYTGLVGDTKYTERNTNWKTQAMDGIIASINETLKLIDDYIKDNPV